MNNSRDFQFFNQLNRMFFGSIGPNRNAFPNRQSSNYQQPSETYSSFLNDFFFPEFDEYDYNAFYSRQPNYYPRQSSNYPRQKVNQKQPNVYPQNPYSKKQDKNDFYSDYKSFPKDQVRQPEKPSQPKKTDINPPKHSVPVSEPPKKQESLSHLPIIFHFQQAGEKQLYPLRKNISLDTTIEEIQQMIAFECKIDDQIVLKYLKNGNFVTIDPKLTLSDVRDEIKEKRCTGKELNIIFVEIKPEEKEEEEVKKEEKIDSIEKVDIEEPKEKVTKSKKPKSISSFRPKIQRIPQEKKEIIKPVQKKQLKKEKEQKRKEEEEEEEKVETKDNEKESISNENRNIYFVQINKEDDVLEIELDDDATVMTLKERIKTIKHVKNLANIKVIFAGKELLNDLVLKSLNIGDIVLFIYIRTEEDILLLTAKALKIGEEEEDYSDDDDD